MFESLENRQFMSVTPVATSTAAITDGTSNTLMVSEVHADTTVARKAGKGQQEFLIVTMKEVFIT
jgi:hypothetical protein